MTLLYILLAAAPATPPVADEFGFDVQCMVVTQQAVEQLKGAEAMATQMAAMYYFGRVDSRLKGGDLEEEMLAAGKAIEGRPLGPILQQCGEYMQTRGKLMEDLGSKLEVREKAGQLN